MQMLSTASQIEEKRAETRFEIREKLDLVVSLTRLSNGHHLSSAVLNDLSPKGARLILDSALEFNERVSINLMSATQKIDVNRNAEVRWMRPMEAASDHWAVGLLFEKSLSEGHIQRLAVAGGIERRASKRFEANTMASVQLNSSREKYTVAILDASEGGIRILAEHPFDVGESIRVFFDGATAGPFSSFGRVSWVKTEQGVTQAGIQIRVDVMPIAIELGSAAFKTSQ